MSEQKIGIITECVCDLPKSIIKEYGIEILYFLVETDSGVFSDTDEITAKNILEYMHSGGKKAISHEPSVEVYKAKFCEMLKKYDEVIHITISSKTSNSYSNAATAVKEMGDDGKKIHVFDSWHLSTGQGHIVIKAAEMARQGSSADEILAALAELRNRVSSTFIVGDIDHLYRNGRASKKVKDICETLHLHPVLMMKDGVLTVKSILLGNFEKVCARYIRRELKRGGGIDKKRLFITHAGCSVKKIAWIKREVQKRCPVDELLVTEASATVSSNCGPDTFGLLFVRNS